MTKSMSLRFMLITFFFCLFTAGMAQQRKIQNKPYIDERKFHYGFYIGIHDQSFQLENNGYIEPESEQQWVAAADRANIGFTVGVLGEWRLNRYLGLRVLPGLHFGSKHITFRELNSGKTESQDMKSCYVNVPVDLKIAAPRFNNYRPYVIAGLSPMYDLITSKQTQLRAKPFNLMLEAGLGCDLYLPFFKFIPELKFCFGLGNVLKKDRKDLQDPKQRIYTESVNSAAAGMFVLTFYFE